MVRKVSIKNLDDFKKVYNKSSGLLKQTLKAAFPELYQKMIGGYKDVATTVNKLRNATPKATPQVSKVSSAVTKVGNLAKNAARGTIGLTGRLAPIQGISNLVSPESDTTDKLSGLGMIGAGGAALAGAAFAPEIATGLVVGDLLKKHVAAPLGSTIGNAIYRNNDPRYNFQAGDKIINQYDLAPELRSLTPEQQELVTAYNKRMMDNYLNQAQQGIEDNQALQEEYKQGEQRLQEIENALTNDVRGGSYPAPNVSKTQPVFNNVSYPVSNQSVQNAQQGGLNLIQDTQVVNSNQPALNSIVGPVNYSNEYQIGANKIINQLQENAMGGNQPMAMNNPSDLRGYAQIDASQLAPVPQQISGIDYGQMLKDFNTAMAADRKQNTINALINSAGALGDNGMPDFTFQMPNGQPLTVRFKQPSQSYTPLPTNTSGNVDQLLGALRIQQAQQQAALAQQQQEQANLKAQREYVDMINAANALGSATGYDPRIFMNTDYGQAVIQQLIHPEAQASANIRETIGKAPTQASLKQAEQMQDIAGKLDVAQLNQQYNMMIQNAKDNAAMARTQAEQMGMNKRAAAQIEAQAYNTAIVQGYENMRQQAALNNAIQLQGMKGEQGMNIANIYANRPSGSSNALSYEQQLVKGMVEQGMPSAQIIKTMQGLGFTNFGLSPQEAAELGQ